MCHSAPAPPVDEAVWPMYCRKCHYSLRGLENPSCPECGHPYDPDDPGTYDAEPTTRLRQGLRLFALALVLGWAIIALGMYIAGSLALGDWRFPLSMGNIAFLLIVPTVISTVPSLCIVIGALRLESRVERVVAIVVVQAIVALCTGWLWYSFCAFVAAV